MSVAFKKLDGVRGAEVSLEAGTVALELAPGNRVTLEQVRNVIRRNGFTPHEATVEAGGKVVERPGGFALEVGGTREVLFLERQAVGRYLGRSVSVTGSVANEAKTGPATLQIASIGAAPP